MSKGHKIYIVNLRALAESRIVIDPDVCSGKARIRGTRVTVADVLLTLAEGLTESDVLRAHRGLRAEDIRAALAYSYCMADGIKLKLGSGAGSEIVEVEAGHRVSDPTSHHFTQVLEAQAAIQAELTKNKITEIKEEKARHAAPKALAPDKREFEFEISLSPDESTYIFRASDHYDQPLDMKYDVYVFELRADGLSWLTYSNKEGLELDSGLKRTVKLSYEDGGSTKEAIFDGYLTSDRHHKVFIQRHADGRVGGRGL